MNEAEYELECNRAELLGLPKPSREEFLAKFEKLPEANSEEAEEITTELAEEMESRKEGIQKIGGGLEELNSILLSTQKKLNSFKTVCGNLGRVFNLHTNSNIKNTKEEDLRTNKFDSSNTKPSAGRNEDSEFSQSCSKTNTDSQLGKLDSLIMKAEKAELSLHSQNKQMKKFLN